MHIVCEDLAQYGVFLVSPSASDYRLLIADILNRVLSRPQGGPPSDEKAITFNFERRAAAVLVNRASRAIASMAYIWHVRLGHRDGRIVTSSYSPGTNASVLLPFELNERTRKFHCYWHTIFPGSKRLIRFDGSVLGDNTDVRPPEPDELWSGGFWSCGGGNEREGREPIKLTLDGIFFEDGGFAGPDQLDLWEQTVSAADAYLEIGSLAREAQHSGMPPEEVFLRIEIMTGHSRDGRLPPPVPPLRLPPGERSPGSLRKRECGMIGWRILQMRRHLGDDAVLERIARWSEMAVPEFHRL